MTRKKHRQPYTPSIDRRAPGVLIPFRGKTADRIVDDPMSDTGGKQIATVSLRDDPLGRMHARRQIDDCQLAAGRYMQSLLEMTRIGSLRSPDPAREYVDGRAGQAVPITARQMRASDKLRQARDVLGVRSYGLLCAVLAERQFIEHVAALVGQSGNWESRKLTGRFRDALDELAVLFGYAHEAPSKRRVHDKYSEMARGLKAAA
jgi:hypothetical protein